MINPKALLVDLKVEVTRLERDLRPTGEKDPGLHKEWQDARAADRTAADFETWLKDRVTQVAVAWILATVFVRFAEDNDLIEYPYLAGPGEERTAQARERQEEYLHHPDHQRETDRHWIKAAFDEMGKSPVAKALFDEHNPMWSIPPSNDAAKDLIAFWRTTDANGHLAHDFTDKTWNTRFLGNLYQDLSKEARKAYALLQTPEFVEEFILKYTLDPAIEEFGLKPEPPYGHADLPKRLRVIDPACGSGHFLLGAFHRLLTAWQAYSPMTDKWQLIANALSSVHGVDKNPYAAAIARFRLMLAAMRQAGVTRLTANVDFKLNIAVGDSLLHGFSSYGSQDRLPFEGEEMAFTYSTEDVTEYIKSVHLLAFGSYHAVFGNPPYITVKDKAEDSEYRIHYPSCHREYSLSVPFAERIFKLAIRGSTDGIGAGYTGQITSNSFMKREFGKKLIDEFFAQVDLTHVIDTSGAYIPGHGTPTVIIFGRWRYARPGSTIRAVRGVRGEPRQPADATKGIVWQAIVDQVDTPGSRGKWVSVDDLDRSQYFSNHPWILESGGRELVERISGASKSTLSSVASRIGYYGDSHADQAFMLPITVRFGEMAARIYGRRFHRGQEIRNWLEESAELAILPYKRDKELLREDELSETFIRLLWPYRTELLNRMDFSGQTYREAGRAWWEWHQLPRDSSGHNWVLAFSDLATHNHFFLNTDGDVYNRHAPIIRLNDNASASDYMGLLALFNSSTACFWLKQVSYPKGGDPMGDEGARVSAEPWSDRYEFIAANLARFPILLSLPVEFADALSSSARQLADASSSDEYDRIRSRMIAFQEELDWDSYRRYGLITDKEAGELIAKIASVPDLKFGQRAFEIVLSRRMRDEGLETQWFERHLSTPIVEIPVHWPDAYKAVVAKRIEFIESNGSIGLIERPECKRRWQSSKWEDKQREVLSAMLLDRCEDRSLWYGPNGNPRPLTINNLADRLRPDSEVVSIARLRKDLDADLADVLAEILTDEHVPYLAQLRYTGEGLLKRAVWEQTWNLQREEDRTDQPLEIPAPPKYKKTDFQKPSFWGHRDKLDFPKERFISYPGAGPDGDDSLLLGWAGWDHREQAYALISLITQRSTTDGWATDRLVPLIAGLAEVMPWVRQWHNEVDPSFGQSPADAYDEFLTVQRLTHHLTDQDLASVKPPAATRRKPAAARGKAPAPKSTGFGPVVAGEQ